MPKLNEAQRRAVEWRGGPVMVLAGAGSGKTMVITQRVVRLIERDGITPERILALTFTNKAAREMSQRVAKTAPRLAKLPVKQRPWIGTFHALGLQILRRHGALLGYRGDFAIYDGGDQLSLLQNLLQGQQEGREKNLAAREALWLLQKRRGEGQAALTGSASSENERLLAELQQAYENELRTLNAVDFEDLLHLPLKLFREHPKVEAFWESAYDAVLVDEYQDTNQAQYALLKILAGRHRNLYVVGDDDQAIYQWRGAAPAQLQKLKQEHPDLSIIRLEQNYRSTEIILQAANAVISPNPERLGKKLWGTQGRGKQLQWLMGESEEEELQKVAEHMRQTQRRWQRPWSEFAILYRARHQARKVEEALREAGVAYHLVGGTSFFERREIREALAYLKLLHNPNDVLSLRRILNFPRRGVGNSSLTRLLALAAHQRRSPFDLLGEASAYRGFSEVARRGMSDFHALCTRYRQRFQDGEALGTVFADLLGELRLEEALVREQPRARERIEGFLGELRLSVRRFGEREPRDPKRRQPEEREPERRQPEEREAERRVRLKDYLAHVALFTQLDAQDQHAGRVQLMTVHAAKGLEFPYLYLVGMSDAQFPSQRALEAGQENEERRLAYVAITRARKQLVLSMARTRFKSSTPQRPSRFVLSIPQALFAQGMDRPEPATEAGVSARRGRAFFLENLKKLERNLEQRIENRVENAGRETR